MCQVPVREILWAHGSITHVPHPIRAPGLLSWLWSLVPWDKHGKVGKRWCFCRSVALKGCLRNNKKSEINVCEKCQIGAWGVRLFTHLKAAHILPAQALSTAPSLGTKWVLCFLNCPHVPTVLSPTAEKESDCADGVRGCTGNSMKECRLIHFGFRDA